MLISFPSGFFEWVEVPTEVDLFINSVESLFRDLHNGKFDNEEFEWKIIGSSGYYSLNLERHDLCFDLESLCLISSLINKWGEPFAVYLFEYEPNSPIINSQSNKLESRFISCFIGCFSSNSDFAKSLVGNDTLSKVKNLGIDLKYIDFQRMAEDLFDDTGYFWFESLTDDPGEIYVFRQ
ncbi:MAG: antirestriction protein ArdA [Okeania sp. SIO3C4]|nr:antirestriction protein ArdA [Okeania sp. SIO3C4]